MNLKAKRKLLVISTNAMALTALLLIQENKLNRILKLVSEYPDHQEVLLKASIMTHNESTYQWIGILCLGLLVWNMLFYRQWVKSRKWILEPILILIISYGLTFTFYTYRTFAVKDQLVRNKKVHETQS